MTVCLSKSGVINAQDGPASLILSTTSSLDPPLESKILNWYGGEVKPSALVEFVGSAPHEAVCDVVPGFSRIQHFYPHYDGVLARGK
jgi:hypothetical protein